MSDTIKTIDESLSDLGINIVPSGDDKGTEITNGQLVVGESDGCAETFLGEGDTYPVPVAYHCEIANTTDLVITGATDVTTILASDEGSTTGLFDGLTAGKYLLIGSDYTYGGVEAKIDTLGTVGFSTAIAEYLQNNTPTWTNTPFMATDACYPYDQKGSALATCTSCREQWRFGFNPLASLPIDWDLVTLNINGVDVTKYWARLRISVDITTDPVLEQLNMHVNNWKCNGDGSTEYFGRARYPKTIYVTKHANADKTPISEDIAISLGVTEVRENNEFANGKDDGFILSGVFPVGADSSIPIQVIIDWYPRTAVDGDVELCFEVVAAVEGFVYDGTAVAVVATPVVTSVLSTDINKKFRSIFLITATDALPGDLIYGSLSRVADGSRVADTYAGNVVITSYRVVSHFWRP